VILILGNSRRQRDGELLNLYQNCLDVSHDRRWLCIMMNSALLFVSVINMVRAMVFKLGSTDQRGSAAGSQGVHERIPKMLIVFTTFNNLRQIFSDILKVTCVYVYQAICQELTVCAKQSKHTHHTNVACFPL